MAADLTVRYFHFIAIFVAFSLLTVEHILLQQRLEPAQFRKLLIVDMAYAVSLLVVMVCGFALWFWVGKPAGFYTENWVFYTKIALFFCVVALRFIPRGFLVRSRKHLPAAIDVPKSIIWVIRLELTILLLIPLLAVLMANGVGYIY